MVALVWKSKGEEGEEAEEQEETKESDSVEGMAEEVK